MDLFPTQETPRPSRRRIALLIALFFLLLAAYLAVMFDLQIAHGEEYLRRSLSQIVRSSTVEAARGDITDRNGNLLVGNRQTYTLTFDSSLLPKDVDQNGAILRLVNLCIEHNIPYTDDVPLTASAPFSYVTINDSLQKRFEDHYLKYLKERLEKTLTSRNAKKNNPKQADSVKPDDFYDDPTLNLANMTAEQLFQAMRRDFDIDPSVPDTDARKIIAVRYELALRQKYATNAYILADDVDIHLITLIKDGDYYGAEIGLSSARIYTTSAAAHLLGYTGSINPEEYEKLKSSGYSINATVGRAGVESAFEEYLHGVNGRRISNTNDEGKVTSELYQTTPQPGATVELTLDLDLQEETERLLAEKIRSISAADKRSRAGAAVVMRVGTGEILAMASYPTYDLSTIKQNWSEVSTDKSGPMVNRATSGLYAPGSTFKPLTAIAALEEGKTTTAARIRDTGRWIYPGTKTGPKCWYTAGHGSINVSQAITVSCNYYFAEMGYRLGLDTLNEYCEAFGLGEHTGIEIGDQAGKRAEKETGRDYAPWAAFGQANQVYTPLQLANYTATLAGGGEHYKAHLLRRVISYDNSEILYEAKPELLNKIEIDPKNLDAVLSGMHNLAKSGSVSSQFRSCIVDAACKTGSAQTGGTIANGVFIAFAPYENPEIAVAVVIEKGNAGAALASTAVDIINAYFQEEELPAVVAGENQILP